MTIRDFLAKARERYLMNRLGGSFFFDLFLDDLVRDISSLVGSAQDWQETELVLENALDLYGRSISCLQFQGMRHSNTGDADEPIWGTLTEVAASLRAVLVEQFQLDLPEARVTSLVTEMVKEGMLEEVRLPDGQIAVRPAANPYTLRIRITRVPAGGAPEEVRQSWVGITLPARRESAYAIHQNLATGDLSPGGGGWVVPAQEAIKALGKVDPSASQWFVDHASGSGALVFRGDEAELVTH